MLASRLLPLALFSGLAFALPLRDEVKEVANEIASNKTNTTLAAFLDGGDFMDEDSLDGTTSLHGSETLGGEGLNDGLDGTLGGTTYGDGKKDGYVVVALGIVPVAEDKYETVLIGLQLIVGKGTLKLQWTLVKPLYKLVLSLLKKLESLLAYLKYYGCTLKLNERGALISLKLPIYCATQTLSAVAVLHKIHAYIWLYIAQCLSLDIA